MEELFQGKFNNYSRKYIEGKIEVAEITKEDILKVNEEFEENILKLDEKLDERKTKLEEYLRIYKIKNKEENTKVLEVEKLKDDVKENIKNIKDKLKNPRYLEQLNKKFIIFSKEENSNYKLELQIIKDTFPRIDLKKLQENYYKELSVLLNEKIDLVSVIFIFFEDPDMKTENNEDRLKVYLVKKFSDIENQLEKIGDNISGKLTEGLNLISRTFDNDKKPKIYKKFLEKALEKEYIIKNYSELGGLLYFKDYNLLGEYSLSGSKSLFYKIKIARIENDEGILLKKRFINHILKKYFLYNDSIREMVYFILGDIDKMYEYQGLILKNFDKFMEKNLGTSEINGLLNKIKIEIRKNIEDINKINNLKADIEKVICLIEAFLNLEEVDVEISNEEFKLLGAKNILTWANIIDKIKKSYDKVEILNDKELKIDLARIVSSDGNIIQEEVIINLENIKRCIAHMQNIIGLSDDNEMEYNKKSFLIFLINLEKRMG